MTRSEKRSVEVLGPGVMPIGLAERLVLQVFHCPMQHRCLRQFAIEQQLASDMLAAQNAID